MLMTQIPTLNKTNMRNALKWAPPGSNGTIRWSDIEIVKMKIEAGAPLEERNPVEIYIPLNINSETVFTANDLEAFVRSFERVWGEIPFGSSPGLTLRRRKTCLYICTKV